MSNLLESDIPEYSIVIPVYNSASSLEELSLRIDKVFESLNKTYEILMIDDGSLDDSWLIMKSIRETNKQVKIIQLMRNFGQHNAIICGFHHVSGTYIITMDDDLQNPPEEIPKLIREMEKGYDLVIGARESKHDSFLRRIGSSLIGRVTTRIFACPKNFKFSSFRIITRNLMEGVKDQKTPYPYIAGMLLSLTKNVGNIAVKNARRRHGQSNYTLVKLLNHGLNLIIYYTSFPLNVLTAIGFLVAVFSFCFAIFYAARKMISGYTVPGWTSVVVLLSFFNGLLLLVLSLIGQYLGRIVNEVSNRQQFMVREKLL